MGYKWLASNKVNGIGTGVTTGGQGADSGESSGWNAYSEYALAHKKMGDDYYAGCGWFVGAMNNGSFNANPSLYTCPPAPPYVKDGVTVTSSTTSAPMPTKTKMLIGAGLVVGGYFLLKKGR